MEKSVPTYFSFKARHCFQINHVFEEALLVRKQWMILSVGRGEGGLLSHPPPHSGIIFQLGCNSDHIGNPFSSLFYPHRSEYPTPFHLMWPRIHNQKILDPVWGARRMQ